MMIDTYYKKDGKEYAKQYGTEVEVGHDDVQVKIDGINYTLRHAKAPKAEPENLEIVFSEEPAQTIKPTKKKKTYKRKK